MDSSGFPDWDYMPGEEGQPFEYKASDWGWFDGRLVSVDYSAPAFDTPEESAALLRAAYAALVSDDDNRPEGESSCP